MAKNNGVIVPELVGLNRASTFLGFCSLHDDAIFAPIEKQAFSGSQEQCFLLAYRAWAKEIYTKNASASLADVRRDADRGRSKVEQRAIQESNFPLDIGISAGLRDLDICKSTHDRILIEKDFEPVRAYVIELAGPPDVMCSGGFLPEQDFDGRELQDVADVGLTPHALTVSSFHGGDCGAVVFSWLADSDPTCQRFVASLDRIEDRALSGALLRFLFEHCENVHMRPDWWEALPVDTRNGLVRRMATSADPFMGRPRAVLANDGLAYPSWNVIRRYSVGH